MKKKRFNKNYLLSRMGSLKSFWQLRRSLMKLDFYRLRSLFKARNTKDEAAAETTALRALARGTYLPIIFAGLVALGLYLFDHYIYVFTGWHVLANNAVGRYLKNPLDANSYVQLLTTVAAVTGVFLGLYFTAVSTVIANAYSNVPNDIRELLIKDRLGNVYVKAVSFLTSLSVILLSMSAGGGKPLHLVPPLLIALSGFAVFAFARLGQRAFFLSDRTLLANTIAYELRRWAERSTHKGWNWRDINFQEHYRKQASKSASTLTALARISGTQPELQGDAYTRLLNKLLYTVRYYHGLKPLIPSASRWFGKKYEHQQWYLTESTALDMASQTDTALSPNEVPDANWVEEELLGVVFDTLGDEAGKKYYEAIYSMLTAFPDFFDSVGKNWLAEEGELWCDKVTEKVVKTMAAQPPTATDVRPAYVVAVADICAALPVSLELGFIKAIGEIDVEKLRSDLSKTDWTKPGSPYKFRLPFSTIKALEQIQENANFEKSAQVAYMSPAWYVVEYAFNNLDWSLFRQWEQLLKLIERWYFATGEELANAGQYKHAAAVYTRALELAWKLDSHIKSLKKVAEALREGSKLEFQRPEWEWDTAHERVAKFRNKAIDEMAKLIPHLLPEPPNSDMPDYFGEAVHKTGEACFDALMEGDADRFKSLFGPYFVGILGTFDNVRPQVIEWEPSTALTWLAEPIIDLFDISGYAYILAEFHGKPELWQACQRVWNAYLSGDGQQDRLRLLAGLSSHYQNLYGVLSPRATLRSQRQIRLGRLFETLPRRTVTDPFSDPPTVHDSAFIRNIAPIRDMIMFTDAIDIFTVKYLMTLPAANGLDFGVNQSKIDEIKRDEEDTQ